MCGRYYRRSDKQKLAEAFRVGKLPPGFELPPDFNIAPSTNQPIVRIDAETGNRCISLMRWGLVPAKVANPDAFKIYTTTNARAESILEKPIWRGPFLQSRCLVPIDGFYEWLQRPSLPQPPGTARAGIDAGNQAWIDGVKTDEVARIIATYTENAVDRGPSGECITGRTQIEQHMTTQLANLGRARSASVQSWGSTQHGNFVYGWGQAKATVDGGKHLVERYLTVATTG